MLLAATETDSSRLDADRLLGAHIDLPTSGRRSNAAALPVEGWVVAREGRAARVEVVAGGTVLATMPVSVDRPDVAAHFREPRAQRSGFRGVVDVTMLSGSDLEVRAVLATGQVAHIGEIRVRRQWHSGGHASERGVVSIVIPCYNQAHFLADAIESALHQRYPRLEVLVVDDGSPDNTGEVAARYPGVRYVHQDNAGLSAARNTGIRRTNGEFLVFLDADDRLPRDSVAASIAVLDDHPECALTSGEHCYIDADGAVTERWTRPVPADRHYAELLRKNYIGCPAAAVYRRAVFRLVGGFDTRRAIEPCADYEMYLRIARRFPVCAHGELTAEYRRYAAAMSDDPGRMLVSAIRVLQEQKAFVRTDAALRAAFEDGMRYWRNYYGPTLAGRIRRQLRQPGQRTQSLRGVLQLARYAPRQLAACVSE